MKTKGSMRAPTHVGRERTLTSKERLCGKVGESTSKHKRTHTYAGREHLQAWGEIRGSTPSHSGEKQSSQATGEALVLHIHVMLWNEILSIFWKNSYIKNLSKRKKNYTPIYQKQWKNYLKKPPHISKTHLKKKKTLHTPTLLMH